MERAQNKKKRVSVDDDKTWKERKPILFDEGETVLLYVHTDERLCPPVRSGQIPASQTL
jgi:hypothetical protein